MEMYKLKFTRLQNEIFRLLCVRAGSSLNQREMSKILKVSPTAIAKALSLLEKQGFVEIKSVGAINFNNVGLNRNNDKILGFKRVENLKMIYESEIVKFLEEHFPSSAIILFGSYSRGDDVWTDDFEGHISDIDIAIIGAREKEIDLKKFEKLLERKIIINFYSSFKDIHKNLKDNILNGIILSGSVDL